MIRYRRYGKELLLFEQVNQVSSEPSQSGGKGKSPVGGQYATVTDDLGKADAGLKTLYEAFHAFATTLGDDIQVTTLRYYIAFRRLRNFACVEVHPQSKELRVYLKVDPESIKLMPGFTRDVTNIGHLGTGDLEVRLKSADELEAVKPLIIKSYERS